MTIMNSGMKRIWFQTDTIEYNPQFEKELNDDGVEVHFGKSQDIALENTLIITNDPEVYSKNKNLLVCLEGDVDFKDFPDAKYIVLDVWDTENEYFFKVWERLNNIPWTISETERLVIRETVEEDLPSLQQIYSDPEITKYTEPLYEDPNEELTYIKEYREKVYAIQGFGIWSLIRKEDNKLIGRAGLVSRPDYDQVEIGFVVGKEYQRKGYATEAIKACLDIAEKLGFEKVRALVMPDNKRSVKLLTKLGFADAGRCMHHAELYLVLEKELSKMV